MEYMVDYVKARVHVSDMTINFWSAIVIVLGGNPLVRRRALCDDKMT